MLTEERIKRNECEFIKLLRSTERSGIDNLITWLQTETNFFTNPASTIYHLNCKGGLVEHSLNVKHAFDILTLQFNARVPQDTSTITTLLHDLCKYDNYQKDNDKYIYNPNATKGHGQKSVDLALQFIDLTEKEEAMIKWHMSFYRDGDKFNEIKNHLSKCHPEAHLIYFADHIATLYMDDKHEP